MKLRLVDHVKGISEKRWYYASNNPDKTDWSWPWRSVIVMLEGL